MGRLLASNTSVPLKIAQREATPEKFLPYARHINEEMVALDSGDIMLTFELQGRAFETSDVRDLNDWHTKLNGLLRNLHDERLSVWTHLIRMRVDQYPGGAVKSGFAADLDRAYFGRINRERMFINRFFVSLVIRPAATGSDKIIQLFKRKVYKQAMRRWSNCLMIKRATLKNSWRAVSRADAQYMNIAD